MNIWTILLGILSFGVLVTVHEFGHFIAARSQGIRVLEFAIGFGPAIFKKETPETLYSLRCVPLGGYCKMEGEEEQSDADGSFSTKKPMSRFLVVAAGASMNVLIAILVFILVAFFGGTVGNTISTVTEGAPAEAAGLLPGDKIIAVDGDRVPIYDDLYYTVMDHIGETVPFTVKRGGETVTLDVSLASEGSVLGASFSRTNHELLESIRYGFVKSFWIFTTTIREIVKMVSGGTQVELTGPVGIVYMIGETVQSGGSIGAALLNFLNLFALISVSIGLTNLLPLPALDGGRLLFIIVELLRGKPVPVEKESLVHMVGLALLLLLSVFILYQDLIRYIF